MNAQPIPVLIVDDDPTFGAFLQLLVRKMGEREPCEAKWVTTGAAMLSELGRKQYELILLDYNLQDTDGLELLSEIRLLPMGNRPAVIMLTGAGSEEVAVEAMKLGARDYLVKGAFDLPALRRAILAAMERRRLEVQLAQSADELRQRSQQMEAELAMAREVQQALLPQQYPTIPRGAAEGAALRFYHRWIPSSAVAGDFFEVFPVSDTAAGVFICDVMGHGVRAALITALMRGLLEELTPLAADPGRFLGELNRSLKTILQRTNEIVFATAFYLVIDPVRGELRFANAGHPHPLHVQHSAGTVTTLQCEAGPDPALGLIPDIEYQTTTRAAGSEDVVLLFTDGLFEAAGEGGEEFGLHRLRQAVRSRLGLAVPPLFDALLGEVKEFQAPGQSAGFADDVCLVAVELPGGATNSAMTEAPGLACESGASR